ncbi:MAG: DUF1924 domain-containing protein [Gammaproteobacteria bacterium]
MVRGLLLFGVTCVATLVHAQTPAAIIAHYEEAARATDSGFTASPERGKAFYYARRPYRGDKTVGCTTCHGNHPTDTGRTRAFKPLKPLAPSVNPERLTDLKFVEKWMNRGCKDVYKRLCTPQEKADVLSFLVSVK